MIPSHAETAAPISASVYALLTVATALILVAASIYHSRRNRRKQLERLRAGWGLIRRVSTLDDDRVADGWQALKSPDQEKVGIDTRTWDDLDLDRVVATLDRTHTSLGQQMFYHRLRAGVRWQESPWLEELTQRFSKDSQLREAIGMQLSSSGKTLGLGFWVITRAEAIRTRWWYWWFPILATTMAISIVMMPIEPRLLLLVGALFVINMAVRMATAWQLPGVLGPMRQLAPLIQSARRLARIVGNDQVLSEVGRLKPLERIAKWVSRDPATTNEILASIWEYLNLMFILDANALLFGARHLRRLGPELIQVARWTGQVDLALMVASLRAEDRLWCIPLPSPGSPSSGTGMWHPLIEEPVPNDVELPAGGGLIITGANMSGKSTYLRTVGVSAVLAQTLNTCPATSWSAEQFRIRSLIGRSDDLAAGKSYYQVEADGVVGMLNDAGGDLPTLFLLDELLRGTNTIERLAAGEAVLRALLDDGVGSRDVVVVATHDGELVSMLRGLYLPWHFREEVGAEGLEFDFQRHEGAATTRTAIALLEATGAPESVVHAARLRAAELDIGPGN